MNLRTRYTETSLNWISRDERYAQLVRLQYLHHSCIGKTSTIRHVEQWQKECIICLGQLHSLQVVKRCGAKRRGKMT
jgi:hypothetical protein